MDDTAQPLAAETDPMAAAAEVFKAFDANPAPDEPEPVPRDEQGRFAPRTPAEETEIEAEEGQPETAESDAEQAPEGEEAAEEAQPPAVEMPASWAKEDAEIWSALPPEVQGKIAEREGQRDAAVNLKFQEAANVRRAVEAIQAEAQANREQAIAATDAAIQLLQPQWPSPSMLDVNSGDYDPDTYHLQRAQAESAQAQIQQLFGQRQNLVAQAQQQQQAAEAQHAAMINQATMPAFEAAYPEIKERAKAEPFLAELMKFAHEAGAPPEFFTSGPITALEWHLIADAKKWRDHQAALKKVKAEQKPAPKAAQPAVRPGVTTPRSAVEATKRKAAMERLGRTGSIEDAAAVFKNF